MGKETPTKLTTKIAQGLILLLVWYETSTYGASLAYGGSL